MSYVLATDSSALCSSVAENPGSSSHVISFLQLMLLTWPDILVMTWLSKAVSSRQVKSKAVRKWLEEMGFWYPVISSHGRLIAIFVSQTDPWLMEERGCGGPGNFLKHVYFKSFSHNYTTVWNFVVIWDGFMKLKKNSLKAKALTWSRISLPWLSWL